MGSKVTYACERCGRTKTTYKSHYDKSKRHFCSRACNMATMNAELNPTRMTESTKEKLRAARLDSGQGKTYTKVHGIHEHRLVAANMILGRKLRPGEIVHHIDGNKRNNSPDNLMVFKSQSEHVRWHLENDPNFGRSKGGDAL